MLGFIQYYNKTILLHNTKTNLKAFRYHNINWWDIQRKNVVNNVDMSNLSLSVQWSQVSHLRWASYTFLDTPVISTQSYNVPGAFSRRRRHFCFIRAGWWWRRLCFPTHLVLALFILLTLKTFVTVIETHICRHTEDII